MAMNALGRHLADRIRLHGPLSIAEYMTAALGHPKWGYYTTRDPLGRRGDFITAPEVSQMFGELIGLWCADRWQAMGAPENFIWAELGPGRGTLMADALRAGGALPGFVEAAAIHLVETSPVLRAAQKDALTGRDISWHERIADLPAGPLILVANEFLDALPIRQFQYQDNGWHERKVDLEKDHFRLVLDPSPTPATPMADAGHGDIAELSPARASAVTEVAQRIVQHGGAGLFIDYGHGKTAPGDTFQAMAAHGYTDPLASPGDADLTSHVDFQALAEAAQAAGAETTGPVSQSQFLQSLGIGIRAERLQQTTSPAQTENIRAALHRLVDDDQMGQLFKVMAVSPPGGPPPPGFEE